EAVEWPRNWHQSWRFLSPYVGDGAAHLAVWGLCPEGLASKLKPVVQGLKGWKARNRLKEPMTCILNVLLDLALLPAGRGIAKFGLEEVVAGHRHEADGDVALLATAHLVDCRAHVVVDATARNAAKHAEGMIVGVEQHLMGLEEIGTDDKGPAVAKLRMRHLQLGALIADDRPVLRPVELEGFSGLESQRHECPASCRLSPSLPVCLPFPREGCNTAIRTVVAEAYQIGMELLQGALLLAALLGLRLQPGRQPISERIKPARPLRDLELRLYVVKAQIFADGIPG